MGRGNRARNEFTVERAAPPDHSPKLRSSELRVVRWADTTPSLDTDDWNNFLSDVGRRNYGIGQARSLGSVAITLVPAKEMGRMLQAKYPDAYRDPNRLTRLHRRVRDNINAFVQKNIRKSFDMRTCEMEAAFELRSKDMLVEGFSNQLSAGWDAPTTEAQSHSAANLETARTVLQDTVLPMAGKPTVFNAGTYVSPRIEPFGYGYAVDLSSNEVLSYERQQLLTYLRDGEGLRTATLEHDGWQPHATIFDFNEHIRSAALGYRRDIPVVMGFEAVHAVMPPRAN